MGKELLVLLVSAILSQVECMPPPAPLSVTVTNATSRTASISLVPADNAPASPMYRISMVPQMSGRQTVTVTLSGSIFSVSGLSPDSDYTVQVVAVSGGEVSAAVTTTTRTMPDIPSGPPQNIQTADKTQTTLTLTWEDPEADEINDRDGLTGFVVSLGGVRIGTPSGRSFTIMNLLPGQSYRGEILAVNQQGEAAERFAASYSGTTADGRPDPPSFSVVLPLFSLTYLIWTEPNPSRGDITMYEIRYMAGGQRITTGIETGGSMSKVVSGLRSHVGTSHTVSIRAMTSAGWGPYSTPLEFDFNPIVTITPSVLDCNTMKLSFEVNPLPPFSGAQLNSMSITYHKVVGDDPTKSLTVSFSTTPSPVCTADVEMGIVYNFDYNVDVTLVGLGVNAATDFPVGFNFEIPSTCTMPETECSAGTSVFSSGLCLVTMVVALLWAVLLQS